MVLRAEIRQRRQMGGDVRRFWKRNRTASHKAHARSADLAALGHRPILRGARFACAAFFLAAACLPAERAVWAQQGPTDSEVKAAFLFNFLKFVDWPEEAAKDPKSPFTLGVLGDTSIGEDLQLLVSGKSIRGRELEVKKFTSVADLRECHILFIGASEKKHLPAILASLRGSSVLTVGDMDHFVETGGMIQFVIEDSRVRMAIDVGATTRAHLKVSSKLLSLAVAVIDSAGGAKN
jgi:YfiR/HmsC-like